MSRRWLVPEVVQTSAMDCGPAVLACLLRGHGLPTSYGRLREACQTEVDGTSIDTLEAVANQLGLAAEQNMLPADHPLLPESAALPAILIIRQPGGATHFVLAWRRHGPFVQVMDPAVGRRWMRSERLTADLFIHTHRVPAAAFGEWAAGDQFQRALVRRLRTLGQRRAGRDLLSEATAQGWRSLAAFDAALRLTAELVRSGSLVRGNEAITTLQAVWTAAAAGDTELIPKAFWFARPVAADGEELVELRGAVLVRATGRQPAATPAELPPELTAAVREPRPRPIREACRRAGRGFVWSGVLLAAAAVLTAGLGVVEAVAWRGVIDLGRDLGLATQRLAAVALIAVLTGVLLGLEWGVAAGWARLGRRLEVRLRLAFALKVPRLTDRYFQSRPISDMAQRAHGLARLRDLPRLAGQSVQTVAALVLTAAAIAVFDPPSAWHAFAAAAAALLIPLAFRPWLTETDLRLQTHAGALTRFTFDALQGLVAVRAHSGERNVRREQEALLVEWLRTARRYLAGVLLLEGVQSFVGIAMAGWLLVRHVGRVGDTGGALLLAYWALSLPALGSRMAALLREYPWQRNTLLRALEPLGALESEEPPGPRSSSVATAEGVDLRFESVTVRAAGQVILSDLSLSVAAGEHVAIVGSSGAGKSSLFGVLLGWHRPAAGEVRVDGRPLDTAGVDELRTQTAWVDPAVQLWNRSLADNLLYGRDPSAAANIGAVLRQADLLTVLDRLPDGLQTELGEGGGLLSGGQGQRVRVGRAMIHAGARLVLLDEPFRGLERPRRRDLTARARQLWAGRTLLVVTHDVEDTRDFDRVLVIANGRVVEDGPPGDLATRPDSRYRTLLDAERVLSTGLRADPMWRRLRVEGGRVEECRT